MPVLRNHPPIEASGEQVLFAMAAAFLTLTATIVAAFFLPVAAGVALVFAVLAVALVGVGMFLRGLLRD